MSVALTGKDITILNDRIFNDLATAETVHIEFPNDLVDGKTGKNGNTVYAFNATGLVVNVTLRLILGSADDKFMNAQRANYINDPAGYILLQERFIKNVGDGKSNKTPIIYQLNGGVISKMTEGRENVEGDIEQAIAIYLIKFANSARLV